MKQNVSAANISAITQALSAGAQREDEPTADELIYRIRERLKSNIEHSRTDRWVDRNDTKQSRDKFRAQAVQDLSDFERALETVPQGYRLVPVLYNRVDPETNKAVDAEFATIRPQFFHFLATEHAAELRAFGICENGIADMKRGLYPQDKDGRAYEVSVDHLIERAGSGIWAEPSMKCRDEKRARVFNICAPVNHFSNLMLVPTEIHEYKNMINDIQGVGRFKEDSARWILMLAPERNARYSGFVAPPQKDPQRQVHAGKVDAHRERAYADNATRRLSSVFNRYAAPQRNPISLDTRYGGFLHNVVEEMCTRLTSAFNKAIAGGTDPQSNSSLRRFLHFYERRQIGILREQVGQLSAPDQALMKTTFENIDIQLRQPPRQGKTFNKAA